MHRQNHIFQFSSKWYLPTSSRRTSDPVPAILTNFRTLPKITEPTRTSRKWNSSNEKSISVIEEHPERIGVHPETIPEYLTHFKKDQTRFL